MTPVLDPGERSRFLSEAECRDIAQRLARYTKGGGETDVHFVSRWHGYVRWARNRITMAGEDRDNRVTVARVVGGQEFFNTLWINDVSDEALVALARRAERLVVKQVEHVDPDLTTRAGSPFQWRDEPFVAPPLFFDATYQLDAEHRADTARQLMQAATTAGMLSAGYIKVSATSYAFIASQGYSRYAQYTWAQYSNTVRDPKGVGSGWAGVDWPDWSKIEGETLSAIALEKCVKSRNPVMVEPGRYTTILEPQAVCDFLKEWGFQEKRWGNESYVGAVFNATPGTEPIGRARFGKKIIDERLTIRTDPMDPELGFPPTKKRNYFIWDNPIYHPATWIERGVLKQLDEDRDYAIGWLGRDTGMPASGAFHMSVEGTTSSVAEMIATTKRGLLVTRFDQMDLGPAMMCRGYTRDGLWLIEDGKISKPVKNMLFYQSIMGTLNNVEQVGVPQRCFNPIPGGIFEWQMDPQPVVAPALKVRDFAFTALSNAI